MSKPQRFLFDTCFELDEAGKSRAPRPPQPTYTEEALAAAREEARAEGIAEGQQQARSDLQAYAASTLATIAECLQQLDEQQRAFAAEVRSEAARLAFCIAERLSGELVRRQPAAELEALIRECLVALPTEPRVVIRVHESLLAGVRDRIDALSHETAFAGKLVLIGEPALPLGDCRVEWADGGAERDSGALQASIEAAVLQFCEATQRAAAHEVQNVRAARSDAEPHNGAAGDGVGERPSEQLQDKTVEA